MGVVEHGQVHKGIVMSYDYVYQVHSCNILTVFAKLSNDGVNARVFGVI